MYTHMCTHTHMYTHICTQVYAQTDEECINAGANVYTYPDACIHASINASINACANVCKHVRTLGLTLV